MTGQRATVEAALPRLVMDLASLAKDQSRAGRYAAAFAEHGAPALVTNASSKPGLIRYADRRFPIMVEDGAIGGTYVANPHSAYVLYARDEFDIVGITRGRWAAHLAINVLDGLLRRIAINRAVHLDNWLLSTNLHGTWMGDGLSAMRKLLTQEFPDHFVILRSLDQWSCPDLLETCKADGWTMLPSRQIWVTDDLQQNWKPRNHTATDHRKLRKSGFEIDEPTEIDAADAERIAELYHGLYVGRYTALNPIYTPRFVQLAASTGALEYRLAREGDGTIMAVAGMSVVGDVVTVPMLGYDTTRPQSEALYRIASYLSSEWAFERGYRHHGSSGASTFKSNRGARGEIEYMAVYGKHLSPARRIGLGVLAKTLEKTMVPMLKKQGW